MPSLFSFSLIDSELIKSDKLKDKIRGNRVKNSHQSSLHPLKVRSGEQRTDADQLAEI